MKISFDEYRAIDAINCSHLKKILVSPLHYKQEDIKEEKSPALIFGGALHCYVLEPEKFSQEYVICPDIDKVKDRSLWKQFKEEHQSKIIIEKDIFDHILNISRRLRESPITNKLISGDFEDTILWEYRNRKFKSRLDIHGPTIISDLKKTVDASQKSFANSVIKYGYDIQGYMYFKAVEITTGIKKPFISIAIEDSAPYALCPYHLDDAWLLRGEKLFNKALDILDDCEQRDYWPDYSKDRIQTLDFPSWAEI